MSRAANARGGPLVSDQERLRSLEEEVSSSFQAYESLWKSRAEMLGRVSLILSAMSDVRAAFSTADQATINAGETAGWPFSSRITFPF